MSAAAAASNMKRAATCPHLYRCVAALQEGQLNQILQELHCHVCRRQPTNLWLCLYPGCWMLGCSDDEKGSPDHSTKHHERNPSHFVQLNVRTKKIWCYGCTREVTNDLAAPAASAAAASGVKTLLSPPPAAAAPSVEEHEREVRRRNYEHYDGGSGSGGNGGNVPGGIVGLANLGNTCYMNAALQCLSNIPALTDYFLVCTGLIENSVNQNTNPEQQQQQQRNNRSLSLAYMNHVKRIWSLNHAAATRGGGGGSLNGGRHVAPQGLLSAFKHSHPMFRGFQQQDSQEFLKYFLDQLHEELMEPVPILNQEDQDSDNEDVSTGNESGQELHQQRQMAGQIEEGGTAEENGLAEEEEEEGDGEEDHEYETADSGVSEQSSSSSSSSSSCDSLNRKRKQEEEEAVSSSGVSAATTTTTTSGDSPAAVARDEGQQQQQPEGLITSGSKRHRSVSLSQKNQPPQIPPKKIHKRIPKTYKSIVSDIFDGKLVSTVQCLTCNRVSTTTETFQDLSLPIPTFDSIQQATARNQRLLASAATSASSSSSSSSLGSSLNPGSMTSLNLAAVDGPSSPGSAAAAIGGGGGGWFGWMWSWVSSWFYGPNITLHDCLAYFFSADELKGENMYSCEKCKKLRNGLKYSRVTVLPDTLCIHLKRFRHDFSFSSKISSRVTFPLVDLDMSPWLHQDCISKETMYDLTGIVCHHGTAGGGHYTAYALNPVNEEWYEFDDSYVTRVEPSAVLNAEAYVLFYRKNCNNNVVRTEDVRSDVHEILRRSQDQRSGGGDMAFGGSLVQHYISRQWLNKFENFAEPGPIDNSDFLCRHGGVLPTKVSHVQDLCVEFPRGAWELLDAEYGTIQLGPTAPAACTRLYPCPTCKAELDALNFQKSFELEEFKRLHQEFQTGNGSELLYCLAMSWFKLWEAFVTGRARDPPGEIDNRGIISNAVNRNPATGAPVSVQVLRPNSDHLRVSHAIWSLFRSIYGGGPEVILKPNGLSVVIPTTTTASLESEAAAAAKKKSLMRMRSTSESSPLCR